MDYHSITYVKNVLKLELSKLTEKNKVHFVEFKHFRVGFYFLGIAYGFCVMILIVEVIVYKAIAKAGKNESHGKL